MGMSGDRPSRRFDIVAETRRRWSEAEKRSIVEEASGPCTNVSAVARRHGMKPSLLFRWKREFCAGVARPPAFMPVALAAPQSPAISSDVEGPAPCPGKRCAIEIELKNGRRVRVGADVDPVVLARIVAALEAAT